MDEVELERMVVRLIGDNAQFMKSMKEAQDAAKQTEKASEETAKGVKAIGDQMTKFGAEVVSTLKSMQGAVQFTALDKMREIGSSAWGWLKSGMNMYAEFEAKQLRLNAAVEANGRVVADVVPKYKAFSESMAEQTSTSKGAVMGMFQQAESMGLMDDQAKRAIKNAIALAAAKGGEAESYLRTTAMLERGHVGRAAHILGLQDAGSEAEKLSLAQQRLSGMFKVAQAEGSSLGGQIKKLGNEYALMQKQFMESIGVIAKPIIELLRWTITAVGQLSPAMKTAIVTAAVLAAAIFGIGIAFIFAGKMFNFFFGGIGIVAGLIITALAGIGVAVGATVAGLGSLGDTVARVKKWLVDTWEWLLPVRQALMSLWETLKTLGVAAWEALKKAALDAWAALGTDNIDWEGIKSNVVDTILFIEFTLLNFNKVWEVVKVRAKLAMYELVAGFMFAFSVQLPALYMGFLTRLPSFYDAWNRLLLMFLKAQADMFVQGVTNVWTMYMNLASNVGTLFKNWKKILQDPAYAFDLWEPVTKGMKFDAGKIDWSKAFDPIKKAWSTFHLPERTRGPIEQSIKDEYERLKGTLMVDFATFRQQKLEQFAKAAKTAGKTVDDELTPPVEKAAKEMHKFDAALFGSAEAMFRIAQYQERVSGPFAGAMGSVAAGAAGGAAAAASAAQAPGAAAPPGQAKAQQTNDTMVSLLSRIAAATEFIAQQGKESQAGGEGGDWDVEGADLT